MPQFCRNHANSSGRWTTYLFEFAHANNTSALYAEIKQALQDFNIEIVSIPALTKIPSHSADLWSLIDPPKLQNASADLEFMQGSDGTFALPWEVRYQLEVCISREIINEYNINKAFVKKLADIAAQDPIKARNILEYVATLENRIYDPLSIFEDPLALAFTSKTEIPHYCAHSRKATITPSTMYLSSPTVETTNRVLRHYSRENKDGRFLRVQFTDEMAEVSLSVRLVPDHSNTHREKSTPVPTSRETTSSSLVSIELSIMAFKLEIATSNFWPSAIHSFGKTAPTSSAQPTICLAKIFASGWVLSITSQWLLSMLPDWASVSPRLEQSMAFLPLTSSRSPTLKITVTALQMALARLVHF